MDNDLQRQLLDSFLEAAGQPVDHLKIAVSATAEDVPEAMTRKEQDMAPRLESAADEALAAPPPQDLYAESATPIGSSAPAGSQPAESSSGPTAGSIAATFLESGLGILPVVTGLIGLFSGGSPEPPALEKYQMPSSIAFESAVTGTALRAADFDQMGAPRAERSGSAAPPPYDSGTPDASAGGPAWESPGGPNGAGPQITVNVQTMDARSFLDNSDQIAQAVRGAMLNLSSINDVVNEL